MGITEACGIKATQNSFRIRFLLTVACKNAMHQTVTSALYRRLNQINVTTLNNSNGATGERLTIIIYN